MATVPSDAAFHDKSGRGFVVAGAGSGNHGDACSIRPSTLLRTLRGVIEATKVPIGEAEKVTQWASSFGDTDTDNDDATVVAKSPSAWLADISSVFANSKDELSLHLAQLSIAVALLREEARSLPGTSNAGNIPIIWDLIHTALTSQTLKHPLSAASRSAQGFLSVPLCSVIQGGNTDELFRLHVWLPDGQRGDGDFAIHSHQSFGQIWVLAGEGADRSYSIRPADGGDATHAKYALARGEGKQPAPTYSMHHSFSVVQDTPNLVRTIRASSAVHTRGMTYVIPAGLFHRTEVQPDAFHATLSFFDSRRGFKKEAAVLGPKDTESRIQLREPGDAAPASLARKVEAVRRWEVLMEQGREHSLRAEPEHGLRAYDGALSLCDTVEGFPNATHYRRLVLGKLGCTYRRFGRYDQAREILEEALSGIAASPERVEFSGELGVIYRHLDRLEDARGAFELQYDTAKQLRLRRGMCRAIGNLGMVNYQLSQQQQRRGRDALLDLAIIQLMERVEMARELRENPDIHPNDTATAARAIAELVAWECIGASRLSLCYVARGDVEKAVTAAFESLNIASRLGDATIIAMSRLFYGRALLAAKRRREAIEQFSQSGACTPVIALCKEPSGEHRSYLRELVDLGVDMDAADEQGYSALDYAVFGGDKVTEDIVLAGLRRGLAADGMGDVEVRLELRLEAARLRKGYRDLFQEKMRPVLVSSTRDGGGNNAVRELRRVYAETLHAQEDKRSIFDVLKFIPYRDFLHFGRLPGWGDGLTRRYEPGSGVDFVIFFSYRWIGNEGGRSYPDDAAHTQYRRMVTAAEEFLRMHRSVGRDGLGIWVDHCCIDQADPKPGVCALPMLLAQCDAVISLVGDDYHDRAWCSVEVMMARTLRESYNLHLWYDQVPASSRDRESPDGETGRGADWMLREGRVDLDIVMADKQLTFEEDRPKVLFLERQSKLLGCWDKKILVN